MTQLSAEFVGSTPSDELDDFDSFYRQNREFVHSIALGITQSPVEAEDITQSIFLKLWQRPALFRGGHLRGWLTRITKNRCIDLLRLRARHSTSHDSNDYCRSSGDSVVDEVLNRLQADHLSRLLIALPETQRLMIVESVFNGESHQNIAWSYRIPLGTVKTRIRDGIRRMRREQLKQQGLYPEG